MRLLGKQNSKRNVLGKSKSPTLFIKGKELIPRARISDQMQKNGHYMHNATMLFNNQVNEKILFYHTKWPNAYFNPNKFWYKES